MQERYMTEEEHMELVKTGDAFRKAFGILAATYIAQMPPELEATTTAYLQDQCSIYGTEFYKYIEVLR